MAGFFCLQQSQTMRTNKSTTVFASDQSSSPDTPLSNFLQHTQHQNTIKNA
jgi:hypothetical protein